MHSSPTSALGILLIAVALDRLRGEYPAVLHPVVWLGKTISLLLKVAPRQGRWRPLIFGALLTFGMCGLSAAATLLVLHLVKPIFLLELLVGAYLLKASCALRELTEAARRVNQPLQDGDLPAARLALRSLCSRDPANLDAAEMRAATIQSLAENLSDSWIAPLFYYLLLGVPGAVVYRTINTLDAMIGYRGEYEWLGKVAARLDDIINWLPARLTAGLLLIVGWCLRKDVRSGWRILRRDGSRTPSPNGGRPMAAMAGLLGVALEKKGVYVLGDPHQPLTFEKVQEARRLVTVAGLVAVGLCGAGMVVTQFWFNLALPLLPPYTLQ